MYRLQYVHADRVLAVFAAIALGLSACSKTDPVNPPFGQLRVANAISDSNPIDATVVSIPAGIDNIAFGTGSGFKDVPDGSYRVQLTTTTGAGQVTFAADPTHIGKNHATTVYAVGRMSPPSQATYLVEVPDDAIAGGKSEVQFVHAASQQAGALDIYVTQPGASLLSATPIATLSFRSNNAPQLFAPGAYEIRVTPQGNKVTVLYDSGPAGVSFPAATAQQFALLDSAAPASPLFLLVLTGSGGNFQIQHLAS